MNVTIMPGICLSSVTCFLILVLLHFIMAWWQIYFSKVSRPAHTRAHTQSFFLTLYTIDLITINKAVTCTRSAYGCTCILVHLRKQILFYSKNMPTHRYNHRLITSWDWQLYNLEYSTLTLILYLYLQHK